MKEKMKTDPEVWQQLAEVMTPSIVKVVEFAKRVPYFVQVGQFDMQQSSKPISSSLKISKR